MNSDSIVMNGREIKVGQVCARQGDIYFKYLGPAKETYENVTIVARTVLTPAVGESGHQHNIYPLDSVGTIVRDDPRLLWLQQATQKEPNYLTNFAHANGIGVDEMITFATPPEGAIAVHEPGPLGARDNDQHGQIPLNGNCVFGTYRQLRTELEEKKFAPD